MGLAERDFQFEVPAWTAPGTAEPGVHVERLLSRTVLPSAPRRSSCPGDSTVPLRVNNGSGLAPISLALRDDGEAFVPANPIVPVAISTHASGGVGFPGNIRVTPVSAGAGEAPAVVGDRVVFPNTARDTDLMAEPRPAGADISWQLRSQESPSTDALDFHLPAGGLLRFSKSLPPGTVEVLVEGKRRMLVAPVRAMSADGSSVPASYSISGDVLTTHVELGGDVALPVLVDPELYIFYGYYGETNGSGSWAGWHDAVTSNFELFENADLLEVSAPHGSPFDSYGELYAYAPGPEGKTGSAGITRVDLTGVRHGLEEQSEMQAEIGDSNGSLPVYSFNGSDAEDTKKSPLRDYASFANDGLAFCAEEGGGINEQLCEEERHQGSYFVAADVAAVSSGTTTYSYVGFTGARLTFREPAPPNRVVIKHPGYEGQWLKNPPSGFQIEAESEGLGVHEVALEIPAGNPEGAYLTETQPCEVGNGFTGCPTVVVSEPINLSAVKESGKLELWPSAVGAAGFLGAPKRIGRQALP